MRDEEGFNPNVSFQRGDDGSSFSEDRLIMFILDLHFAGTDTTSNTLLTGFLYLMTYPQIQGRCDRGFESLLLASILQFLLYY